MPEIRDTPVRDLELDLKNFRTIPQKNEVMAVKAMISISQDNFWELTISLLEDGYLPTENIVVLQNGKNDELVVREGNRRIAAMKLIHGLISTKPFDIPDDVLQRIENVTAKWKQENKKVPCAIYGIKESKTVDRIVNLTHGKGVKASRERWEAVARARHNRDMNSASEPALDLLEKYLKIAGNITTEQMQRWAGDYPITVLDETIKKTSKRFGSTNAPDLASKYPNIKHRPKLDKIIRDVGTEILTFKKIRTAEDFLGAYDVPALPVSTVDPQASSEKQKGGTGTQPTAQAASAKNKGTAAVAMNDPRAVKRALKALSPNGNDRQKIVTLRDEALCLDLEDNPIAFCFLLRSMFEISAKVYCDEHKKAGGPSSKDSNGKDKTLNELLKGVTKHLTSNNSDKETLKKLHGAQVELSKSNGILSLTSMNQLVHHPSFTLIAKDISTIFGNVFPLLRAMNE